MSSNQNKLEFRPSKARRIGLSLLLGFPIILMIVLVYGIKSEVTNEDERNLMNVVMAIFYFIIAMFGLFVWVLNTKKIEIDAQAISYSSLLKKKRILLSDIRGYRHSRNGLKTKFYAKKETKKGVISTFLTPELSTWAAENYPNLDQVDYQEEKAEILSDKMFGATTEEREQKLEKAKLVDSGVVVIGFLIAILSMVFKLPFRMNFYFVVFAALWIAYALVKYKGLIRMEWQTAKASMWVPSLVLGFVCFTGFNRVGTLKDSGLLIPVIVVVLITTALYTFLIVKQKNYKFKKIGMTLFLFFILIYSFMSSLNIVLDFSEPSNFETQVVETAREKNSYARRGVTYYTYTMHLAPWNEQSKKNIELNISSENYKNLKQEALIGIKQRKGFFGDHWFTAHQNGEELIEFDIDYFKPASN